MGSLPREEKMAAAAALFLQIEGQKHRVTTKATQHLCLHSLDYIVPSKYPRTLIEPGSFHP
jgi:hypothetical protein